VTDSAREILLSGAWTCQESFLDSWITPHVVKPFIKTSRFFFAFFVTFLRFAMYSNTGNLNRFMIEYELSVGSKCNSLKTNQVFENELGCPRAIQYLTFPLSLIFGAMSTHKEI